MNIETTRMPRRKSF